MLMEHENEVEVRKLNRKKPQNLRTEKANATTLKVYLRECLVILIDMCTPCLCCGSILGCFYYLSAYLALFKRKVGHASRAGALMHPNKCSPI